MQKNALFTDAKCAAQWHAFIIALKQCAADLIHCNTLAVDRLFYDMDSTMFIQLAPLHNCKAQQFPTWPVLKAVIWCSTHNICWVSFKAKI